MISLTNIWIVTILNIIFSLGPYADAYNVLILYPTPSYSHQIGIMALTEKLIEKGHSVTTITTNRVPGLQNNYTHVDISFAYQYFSPTEAQDITVDFQRQLSKWDLFPIIENMMQLLKKEFSCEQFHNFVKKVKDENLQFDLVIIESFYPSFLVPIAHIIAGPKPIVGFVSTSMNTPVEHSLGSFEHYSYLPSIVSDYSNKMSFFKKLENWFSHQYLMFYTMKIYETRSKEFFRENYGKEIESLVDIASSKISMVMISSNHLYFYPRLLSPNIVEVGAMHLKSPEKLPQSLQNWCDGAEKGVIYICLGSNMRSISLPQDVRENFLKVFKELPAGYRVLWKWEKDGKIPGQSDNILTQKWFPQQNLLAHPKVKLFITQGGLQSFQEAVHYGVPMIGIPWFGDQEVNVAKMEDAGIGVKLEPRDLHLFEKIEKAVHTLLFEKRYTENIRKLSAISRDFSARSMDTAIFWVEHLARHGSGDHLKPVTAHASYFEFFCLDILSFILLICVASLYLVYTTSKFLFSLIFCSKSLKIKKT